MQSRKKKNQHITYEELGSHSNEANSVAIV